MKNIELLTEQIKKHNFTHVIGISRGGLIPAVYASHTLNVPMSVVSFSSKKGNGEGSNTNASFNIMPSKDGLPNKSDSILLVDDICDTGYTLLEMHQHLVNEYPNVKTACVHWREGAVCKPDLFQIYLTKEDPWVIYPWEKH